MSAPQTSALQATANDISACILIRCKINACSKNLKEMRDQLAASPLAQDIETLKSDRAELQTKLTSLLGGIPGKWPADLQVVSVNNTLVKPYGIVDVTLVKKVDINIKRDFIHRFDSATPLKRVMKTYNKENERIVASFKRRKNNDGAKKKRAVTPDTESSSDEDGEVPPAVQAALDRMRQEGAAAAAAVVQMEVDDEELEDLEEEE
jgi:hypothetical protein